MPKETKRAAQGLPTLRDLQIIRIKFSLDAESFEGQMLQIAAKHYAGGAENVVAVSESMRNMLVRQILSDWLKARIDFPRLELGMVKYPLPEFDPPEE